MADREKATCSVHTLVNFGRSRVSVGNDDGFASVFLSGALFFLGSVGLPLHSWVFTKGQGKGAPTPTTPTDGPDSTAIEVEDIPALLRDVARFAEAVEKLKDVVLGEGRHRGRRRLWASTAFSAD